MKEEEEEEAIKSIWLSKTLSTISSLRVSCRESLLSGKSKTFTDPLLPTVFPPRLLRERRHVLLKLIGCRVAGCKEVRKKRKESRVKTFTSSFLLEVLFSPSPPLSLLCRFLFVESSCCSRCYSESEVIRSACEVGFLLKMFSRSLSERLLRIEALRSHHTVERTITKLNRTRQLEVVERKPFLFLTTHLTESNTITEAQSKSLSILEDIRRSVQRFLLRFRSLISHPTLNLLLPLTSVANGCQTLV